MTMEIPSTVFCGPEDAKIRRWQEYVLENKVSSGRHSKEGFSVDNVDIQLEVLSNCLQTSCHGH